MDTGTRSFFSPYARRSLQIADVSCSGTELRLTDCGYTTYKYRYCPNDGYGVTCDLGILYCIIESKKCVDNLDNMQCQKH